MGILAKMRVFESLKKRPSLRALAASKLIISLVFVCLQFKSDLVRILVWENSRIGFRRVYPSKVTYIRENKVYVEIFFGPRKIKFLGANTSGTGEQA